MDNTLTIGKPIRYSHISHRNTNPVLTIYYPLKYNTSFDYTLATGIQIQHSLPMSHSPCTNHTLYMSAIYHIHLTTYYARTINRQEISDYLSEILSLRLLQHLLISRGKVNHTYTCVSQKACRNVTLIRRYQLWLDLEGIVSSH